MVSDFAVPFSARWEALFPDLLRSRLVGFLRSYMNRLLSLQDSSSHNPPVPVAPASLSRAARTSAFRIGHMTPLEVPEKIGHMTDIHSRLLQLALPAWHSKRWRDEKDYGAVGGSRYGCAHAGCSGDGLGGG